MIRNNLIGTLAALEQVSIVERQVAEQRATLLERAWDQGATDVQISDALLVPYDTARMKRRRSGRPPLGPRPRET